MLARGSLIIWLVALPAVGFLVWVGYWSLAIYSLQFDCENVVLQEAISPNGRYAATVFERDCGATTSADRIVSMRFASEPFNPEQPDQVVLRVGLRPNITVRWAADDRLLVRTYSTTRYLQRRPSWSDVRVELVD